MKLRKNDLQELLRQGEKAISAKITELQGVLAESSLKLTRGELKDLRAGRSTRRAIAQLQTIMKQGVK